MATTSYILTGGVGTDTHIDLGLKVGTLSLSGQSFSIKGSDGNNSVFLRPAGYEIDFTDNRGGEDKVYLMGMRSEYEVVIDEGVATLSRGAGADSESLKVSASTDNMTIVFADGFLKSDTLTESGGEGLTNTETSTDPDIPSPNGGNVRVGTSYTSGDETNIFGHSGVAFAAYGNGGVDQVFIAAGANVDATKLGVGKDHIFLEGGLSEYETALRGNQITLTRNNIVNALTGETQTEVVKVLGGIGSSNDRLFFANGSIDTRALLMALRTDPVPDITSDSDIWDSQITSFSSASALDEMDNLSLSVDTGLSDADGVSKDGTVAVNGVADGYIWQYRTSSLGSWVTGIGAGFVLPGQTDGEEGITYAAGEVQVRQINPFGVPSPIMVNADDIVVDVLAEGISTQADPLSSMVIEAATFSGGDLVISGTFQGDLSSLAVSWNDDNSETINDPEVQAVVDSETGTWTAAFTQEQMSAMADGTETRFLLKATDAAGNQAATVVSDRLVLELENQTPVVNSEANIVPLIVVAGPVSSSMLLLDMEDLSPGGPVTPGDHVFFDPDAPGTLNATLEYAATLLSGEVLPDWLELTSDGLLRTVEGHVAPALQSPLTISVTATDGAGASAQQQVVINTIPPLTSVISGVSELDVRSDLVLEIAGDRLAFTETDDEYEIRLVQLPDLAGKSGFDGEVSDGGQTIRISVVDGVVSMLGGGTVSIHNGKARIDFEQDFDLANRFALEVDEGLFRSETSGVETRAVVSETISFSTVSPATGAGTRAKILEGDQVADGAVWYDGTSGDYLGNTAGLVADLSGAQGVVVIGRDLNPGLGVKLSASGRTVLTGFGGDDLMYIDREVSDLADELTVNTITVDDNEGNAPTLLTFSAQGGGAGVFITFEDNTNTDFDESQAAATGFSQSDVFGSVANPEYSFEGLVGNATPVIAG